MNPSFFDISLAIAMVAVAAALIIWFREYLTVGSHKRMMRMLKHAGLDPEIATAGDSQAIMQQVRRRCRRCSSEDVCERWLAGNEAGDNSFCPNAKVFEVLKREADSTVVSAYAAVK